MADIRAVLLVPPDGDPHGLLREGPCGAMVPRAWEWEHDGAPLWTSVEDDGNRNLRGEEDPPDALVLWWDGAVIPDGVFRAWWHADDVLYHDGGLSDAAGGLSEVLYADRPADAARIVGTWRRNGAPLGRVVLLDENGREVDRG